MIPYNIPPVPNAVHQSRMDRLPEGKSKKTRADHKERLSIYLAKSNISDHGTLIKVEEAKKPISLKLSDCEATLYIRRVPEKYLPPPWTALFTSRPELPANAFRPTRTEGAVLIVSRHGRVFILAFGQGFNLLKLESMERDFGLRTVLVSVAPKSLRSLDKASFDRNPINSRVQSPTGVPIHGLNVDSELEVLNAVTGTSRVPTFGSLISGKDDLKVVVETDLEKLPSILDEALNRYIEKLPNEFEWIDNIRQVRDDHVLDSLNTQLINSLSSDTHETLWLGEPEVVDWDIQIGYSFDLRSNARPAVLKLSDLISHLRETGKGLSIESLRSTSVHAINADHQSIKSWPAYRCLYAELDQSTYTYILRNGNWYKVDADFAANLNAYIQTIKPYSIKLPVYSQACEEDYNKAVAASDSAYTLMDQNNIKIGGPHDKIEFCDLIRNGTDLIHIKYYRSSSTLSHLFAQGFTSAETFVKDEEFRMRLNDKLPAALKLKDTKARPDTESYCVVYAIATAKRLPIELPFFSKVTLRNATKTLLALGYRVQLATIDLDPQLVAKKNIKPSRNAT